MTKSASDANELLCDNNTVKTHHVNRSDFLKKTWLSRLHSQSTVVECTEQVSPAGRFGPAPRVGRTSVGFPDTGGTGGPLAS